MAVPILAAELPAAVLAMPCASVQQDRRYTLVAVLSPMPDRNMFVAADGRWMKTGRHIAKNISTPLTIAKHTPKLNRDFRADNSRSPTMLPQLLHLCFSGWHQDEQRT